MSSEKPEAVPPHELLLWTRRFAAMIDAGVSLMRCLDVLAAEESTPSLRDITRMLMTAVEQGATLSEVMSGEPPQHEEAAKHFASLPQDWSDRMKMAFDSDYVGTVSFGEVGGILDVALDRLVDRYARGLAPLPPVVPGKLSRAELAEWFHRLAEMLRAGVPLLYALGTLARVSRPPLQGISQEMRGELHAGMALVPTREDERPAMWRYSGIFGPTLRQLAAIGTWHAPLHEALRKAAALLEAEVPLERAGTLAPLSAEPSEKLPPEFAAPREPPVVRQVNDLYVAAIKAEADTIRLLPGQGNQGRAEITRSGQTLSTIALEHFVQCLRVIKVNADIDPFIQEDRRSQIHVRYQGKDYVFQVHSRPTFEGGYFALYLRPEEKAVEL